MELNKWYYRDNEDGITGIMKMVILLYSFLLKKISIITMEQ